MTDYNDGQWHGWNGGECPVHPKSTVQAAYADEGGPLEMDAGEFIWAGDQCAIVAFRVIKAHREPRAIWLVKVDGEPDSDAVWRDSKAKADLAAGLMRSWTAKPIIITRFVEDDK